MIAEAIARAAAEAINSPEPRCWADSYTPGGATSGDSCGHVVTTCRIGLCEKCAQALCADECRCPKKAVAA